MNINYEAKKIVTSMMTAFGYAMGVALAKYACTFISLRGFNLNF